MAFTIKELREMTKLTGCRPELDPADFVATRDLISGVCVSVCVCVCVWCVVCVGREVRTAWG